ncbi:MAG: chromosomal replication initiator protein DnaA [Firmicutes bacterium]|nr:chromosomal replication initiator protein DnaA [Bacillota bacterium]
MNNYGYTQDLWTQMSSTLETEVSAITFDVWIKALEVDQIEDGKLVLIAPTAKAREFVVNRYFDLIKRVMKQHNSLLNELEILDPDGLESRPVDSKQLMVSKLLQPTQSTTSTVLHNNNSKYETTVLNRKYNFDTFVVGKSNQLVHATAMSVAADPGKRYNPLFIHGGVGLGKTHIMHAIGNAVVDRALKNNEQMPRVLYVSSEQFTNEFIESIKSGSQINNSFRDKYRKADVLMVDDVQFFGNKEGTQEEFFHTFNELYNAGKQIVLTSDRPPKEIGSLADRLQSRFECGVIVDVQSPDLETRIAILKKKAQLDNQYIPDDILIFMAERIDKNIREMEGLFNKVVLLSQLDKVSPNTDMVQIALKDFEEKSQGIVTMDTIVDITCNYFKLDRTEVMGKKKTKDIAEARQVCMYLITDILNVPLATIGTLFGGRDHTTVMHARNKVADNIRDNSRYKSIGYKTMIQDIKDMILNK